MDIKINKNKETIIIEYLSGHQTQQMLLVDTLVIINKKNSTDMP